MGSVNTGMSQDAAVQLMQSVARMAVHAGKGVEKGAGTGYVGMLGGMPVKLATHHGERTNAEMNALKGGCAELRGAMKSAVDTLLADKQVDDKTLKTIYKNLGLSGDGKEVANAPLITRKMALAVVKSLGRIVGEPMIDKLKTVVGEKTIKESSVDKVSAAMNDAFDVRSKFMTETLKPMLEAKYPGPGNQAKRYNLALEISTRIIIKDGGLAVLGSSISLENTDEAKNAARSKTTNLKRTLNMLEGKRDAGFADAIGVLFRQTMITKDPNWSASQLGSPATQASRAATGGVKAPSSPAVQKQIASNRASAVNQLAKWCQTTLAFVRGEIAAGRNVEANEKNLGRYLAAFGETAESQKDWAEKYLRNHPEVDPYCDTHLDDATLEKLNGGYAEQLKESLAQAKRFTLNSNSKGIATTFVREVNDKKLEGVTINGAPPRSERKNAEAEPLGEDAKGMPRSYTTSESCKAFLEQLVETIPDPGVRNFVTSSITANGFEMAFGAKFMAGLPVNENYSDVATMLKSHVMQGGNSVEVPKIAITVNADQSIDIRLSGGTGFGLMGATLVPETPMAEIPLFDVKVESHIHIPGGQTVAVGEVPQFTCEVVRPKI